MTTVPRWRASTVWLSCVVALLVVSVLPSRGEEGERHSILVNALDREGHQIPGLTTANFRGEYRGQPVTVVSAAIDTAPRRIVVAMDTSESQGLERGGEAAFTAAGDLLSTLAPRQRVAIFSVANGFTMHSNLTNDPTVLQKALGEARDRIGGATALYDAVLRLSGGFAGRKLGDAICLFTDGEDTVDARDPNAVVTAVADTGVRIFVVRPHPDRPTAGWSVTAAAFLMSIAEATGGSVGWLGESRERSHTFYSMMAEAYRLELVFPRMVDEPRKWKLQVVSPDGKSLPKVRLVYPHLITPLVPER
jgi:hypothetical protein